MREQAAEGPKEENAVPKEKELTSNQISSLQKSTEALVKVKEELANAFLELTEPIKDLLPKYMVTLLPTLIAKADAWEAEVDVISESKKGDAKGLKVCANDCKSEIKGAIARLKLLTDDASQQLSVSEIIAR